MENRGTGAACAEAENLANILRGRSGTHGDAHDNLRDIARRWTHLIRNQLIVFGYSPEEAAERITLTVDDVAYMMVEMKLSRATYGDSQEVDHFRDIMGYAAIGASFVDLESEKTNSKDS